ncbi:MAG: hypothetical protein AB1757_30105 [Acidobacteriota bacterium]
MTKDAPKPLHIKDAQEFWLHLTDAEVSASRLLYRPAMLIECRVNFRSLRAGLHHSEERHYSAWIPESDLAIDWDKPAISADRELKYQAVANANIDYEPGTYETTLAEFAQYETELIDKLARAEKLRLYFNPVFGLFSAPEDDLKDFLARIAEAALGRVEPELKRLRNKFELQLEQIRERHAAIDVSAEEISDTWITRQRWFFESENRLAQLFSTLAGRVFRSTKPKPITGPLTLADTELREDLARIEQEAGEALKKLYDEYVTLAGEYDVFEIGLQPDNVKVTRRLVLWVPVIQEHHAAASE